MQDTDQESSGMDPRIRIRTKRQSRTLLYSSILLDPRKLEFLFLLKTKYFFLEYSVADPGCLSRIPDRSRISDPGSRIPDPKTATKERGEKKNFVIPFYVATNLTKLEIILVLKC